MTTYINSADEPTPGNRTLTIQVADGRFNSNLLSINISVTLLNDNNLTISCSDGNVTTFTESDGNGAPIPVTIAPNLRLIDKDSDHTIVFALVELLNPPDGNKETITGQSMFGLMVMNSGSKVTVSTHGKDFMYQPVLSDIQYINKARDPTGGTRTVTFTVTDGHSNATCVQTLVVVTVNDNHPVVDLNGPSLQGSDYDARVLFSGISQHVAVAAKDATITDADGEMTELQLNILNPRDDEKFVVCGIPSAKLCVITYGAVMSSVDDPLMVCDCFSRSGKCDCSSNRGTTSISAEVRSNGYELRLSSTNGEDPFLFQAILTDHVTYSHSSVMPTQLETLRQIQVRAYDGRFYSQDSTTNITVVRLNASPVLDLNGDDVRLV